MIGRLWCFGRRLIGGEFYKDERIIEDRRVFAGFGDPRLLLLRLTEKLTLMNSMVARDQAAKNRKE